MYRFVDLSPPDIESSVFFPSSPVQTTVIEREENKIVSEPIEKQDTNAKELDIRFKYYARLFGPGSQANATEEATSDNLDASSSHKNVHDKKDQEVKKSAQEQTQINRTKSSNNRQAFSALARSNSPNILNLNSGLNVSQLSESRVRNTSLRFTLLRSALMEKRTIVDIPMEAMKEVISMIGNRFDADFPNHLDGPMHVRSLSELDMFFDDEGVLRSRALEGNFFFLSFFPPPPILFVATFVLK